MIVEDEVITQRYLKEILEQYDVDVAGCFDNAEDAIEALKNISCDMILMDININGTMDGIQLARHILQTNKLPIVFISAYSDDETLDEVLELSPYGFVTKPFSSKEVYVTLQIAYKRFLTHEVKDADNHPDTNIVLDEGYTFSLDASMLYCNGKVIKLNVKQNKFLEILAKNINHTVSFEEIILSIWGDETVADSTLRTLVYNIRKLAPELPLHSYSKKGYYITSI